jgi:hypothetical protein
MSIHTPHPDSHTHGLNDDCPRCYEHSLHPFESLDDANLRALTQRVLRGQEARSNNERTAMNVVEMVVFRYRRLEAVGAIPHT